MIKKLIPMLYVLTYFLAFDFVRPSLVAAGGPQAWWGWLGVFLMAGIALTFWLNTSWREKVSVIVTGYALVGCTLYLDDPAIKTKLATVHLGELRIVALVATFLFIAVQVRRNSDKEPALRNHS